MTNGLQRECPRCGELNKPDGLYCIACGAKLVEFGEQVELDESERDHFRKIMGDRGDTAQGAPADTARREGTT